MENSENCVNENSKQCINKLIDNVSNWDGFKTIVTSIIIDYLHEFPQEIDREEREDLKLLINFLNKV